MPEVCPHDLLRTGENSRIDGMSKTLRMGTLETVCWYSFSFFPIGALASPYGTFSPHLRSGDQMVGVYLPLIGKGVNRFSVIILRKFFYALN